MEIEAIEVDEIMKEERAWSFVLGTWKVSENT